MNYGQELLNQKFQRVFAVSERARQGNKKASGPHQDLADLENLR